jgi:hypothetical protein
LIAALVAGIVLLAVALVGAAVLTAQLVGAKQAHIDHAHSELHIARKRIAFLEQTIDEVRARELSTTAPDPAVVRPERLPLPPEIQARLAEVDDPTGELEELARAKLEADPNADPNEVADELFV